MNRDHVSQILRSLRQVSLQGSLFGQTVAIRFGLSESDIQTLEALLDSGASTAGRLSDITGLTSGAVTRVIDRLEQAGYVQRVPDPTDRRRVIVEVVPEKIAAIKSTIDRIGTVGAEEIGRYSDSQLELIRDFLTRMEQITREEATSLREDRGSDTSTSEHAAPVGGLHRARLQFKSGANELLIQGSESIEDLYRAKFEGQVPQVRVRDGVVIVQHKGRFQWDWRDRRADFTLNASLPWDIEVIGGGNKIQGKLTAIDLRSFEMTGGVHQLRLTLGRPTGDVPIRLIGGAHQVRIERPAGAAVRLELTDGAAGIKFDDQTLLVAGTGGGAVFESKGASGAADRYLIEIKGGVSRITVTEAG